MRMKRRIQAVLTVFCLLFAMPAVCPAEEVPAAPETTEAVTETAETSAEEAEAAVTETEETAAAAEETAADEKTQDDPAGASSASAVFDNEESAEDGAEALELRTYWLQDYDSDSHTSYGSGHYQVIGLNGAMRRRWPALADAMDAFSRQEGEDRAASFEEICTDSREISRDTGHEYEASQETDVYPRRADDQVFSFLVYYIGYTGGAHGYYSYMGHNYDPGTGQELVITDVFKDEDVLKDVIWELLLEKYPDGTVGQMVTSLDGYGSGEGKQPLNWTAGPDGVTFFFNPYELASYAEGVQTVTLGYQEYADLYTGKIGQMADNGCCRLVSWLDEEADVDGDGQMETISIAGDRGDDMMIDGFTVSVDGAECEIGQYGYDCVPFLMRTADGRSILYLEIQMDNDIRQTAVLDLTGGAPDSYDILDAGFPSRWEDMVTTTRYPADTDCFRLSHRINFLGTYSGERDYGISNGSTGEPLTDIWQVEYSHPIVVKEALPAYPVDPETGDVSETAAEVPAGEEISVTATDGQTWADMVREDGSIVRVYEDSSSWPHTIDGRDEAEFFETLYYAG